MKMLTRQFNEPDSAPHSPIERFAAECGLRSPLRFLVENVESGRTEKIDVQSPFVLIGQGRGCDLRLVHPDVCYRHAYLQVIQGRLYGFDLDSDHGTAWGRSVRREGVVTFQTNLQIGPFSIRLSRAPAFTQGLESTADDWELENEPLENIRLWFENAGGRSSHSPLRPIRRQITLLGRSNRSHLKLSDASVSKAHCSIVRTEFGFWVVDLLGRTGTRLKDRLVRFSRLTPDETLTVGRFRMRLKDLTRDEAVFHDDAPVLETESTRSSDDQAAVVSVKSQQESAPETATWTAALVERAAGELIRSTQPQEHRLPAVPGEQALSAGVSGGVSENLLLAMMDQFSQMQQQLLSHTQQQMTMLAEMFGTLHKGQHDAVQEQLRSIQAITAELGRLRAEPAAIGVAQPVAPSGDELKHPPLASAESAAVAPEIAREVEPDRVEECCPAIENRSPTAADPVDPPAADQSAATAAAGDSEAGDDPELPVSAPVRESRAGVSSHTWVTQRICELERERSSRWKRLFQLVGGQESHHR